MVHVKKCPCEYGRGRPSTEFYIDGVPQIYCRGWEDKMTDEPLEVCRKCKDFAGGEQVQKDMEALHTCMKCRWYDEWFGVCFNGNSRYRAACPPCPEVHGCKMWGDKQTEEEKSNV